MCHKFPKFLLFLTLLALPVSTRAEVDQTLLGKFDRGDNGVAARHRAWCTPQDQGLQWQAWFDIFSDYLQTLPESRSYSRFTFSLGSISLVGDSWPVGRDKAGLPAMVKVYRNSIPESPQANPCTGVLLNLCSSLWNDGLRTHFNLTGLPPMVGTSGLTTIDRNSGGWMRDNAASISRWWQTNGTDFCASASDNPDDNTGLVLARTLSQITATWRQIRSLADVDLRLSAVLRAHQFALAASGISQKILLNGDKDGQTVVSRWSQRSTMAGYSSNKDGIMLHQGEDIAKHPPPVSQLLYRRGRETARGVALPAALRRFAATLRLHGLVTKNDRNPDRTFAVDLSRLEPVTRYLLPVAAGGNPPIRSFRLNALHWWQWQNYLRSFARVYRDPGAAPAPPGSVPATRLWPGGAHSTILIATRKSLFSPRTAAALVRHQIGSFAHSNFAGLSPVLIPLRSLLDNAIALCHSTSLLRNGFLLYGQVGSSPLSLKRLLGPFNQLCGLLPGFGNGSALEAARTSARILADSSLYWDGFVALAGRQILRLGICPLHGLAIGALATAMAGKSLPATWAPGCPKAPPDSFDSSGFAPARQLVSGQLSSEFGHLGAGTYQVSKRHKLHFWMGRCRQSSQCPVDKFRPLQDSRNLLEGLETSVSALPATSVSGVSFDPAQWAKALDRQNRAIYSADNMLRLVSRQINEQNVATMLVLDFSAQP